MKAILIFILCMGLSGQVLACKRTMLSGSKALMIAVLEKIMHEEGQEFAVEIIQKEGLDFRVKMQGAKQCKSSLYGVKGRSDCTIEVKKINERTCD